MPPRSRRDADELLAAALAGGKTVRDAAEAAGVAERTARRRVRDAAFRARVAELRADMLAAATGRLADSTARAADVLAQLLDAEKEPVRLRAALGVLQEALRARDAVELEARIAALERAAGLGGEGKPPVKPPADPGPEPAGGGDDAGLEGVP